MTVAEILNAIISALKDFFKTFFNGFFDFVKPYLQAVLSVVPDCSEFFNPALSFCAEYLAYINCWVAVDWAYNCLVLYFGFITVMIPIKLLCKFLLRKAS